MANETVANIKQNGKGDFGMDIAVGKYQIVTDLPEAKGGQDTGPNPYEILTSSLAACTALQIRFTANKKKIPLESVEAIIKHNKDEAGKDHFDREIKLNGTLTDEQRQTLLDAADACAVHNTLVNGSEVTAKLVD